MSDAKYFTTTKKGELAELKADLHSEKKEKKKEAVKKIIASMTVGKDVSSLFADVVNCMQTDNLELKKLVYLYLMNYAKTQPDLAILAVNTFSKDCEDPNPLIRALAVRTMGCIRVDKITEYLCEPLRKCLKDDDPYVRKTAAVCVAKLHDINNQLVEDQGFLDLLKDLLSDSTPMVVANAVAALAEIGEISPTAAALTDLDMPTINKLLTALNECTEWGQVFILDSLSNYSPEGEQEAQNICERVTPRLSHANAAVVLSAVKVLMRFMEVISEDSSYFPQLTKKLAPPLVTLLSAEPEIQFVALRNINLIVQKRPDILKEDIKVFFVKYNDPIYVKLEKLDIMIRLATAGNIASVLAELKEYATEVDVDFVRKSVRAIGRCAIKVETASERCVGTLVDLIQTKVTYVVQEAVVVIKDIFRKYPNKYESIIATLCENLDSLDEPEARASMIWILGEYCDRIDNVAELLQSFIDGFHDENAQVQLQLLTSTVKLFLKRPTDTQELVQSVLTLATQESDNPDLRDRGYIYWRLLSTDPAAAKDVVLAEKPTISEETDLLEPALLDELICHISTLASVYHKPPAAFVDGKVPVKRITLSPRAEPSSSQPTDEESPAAVQPTVIQANPGGDDLIGDLLSLDIGPEPVASLPPAPLGGLGGGLDDLLSSDLSGLQLGAPAVSAGMGMGMGMGLGMGMGVSAPPPMPIGGGLDLFSSPSTSGPSFYTPPKAEWLSAANGKGLEIMGTFRRTGGEIFADMTFTNRALGPMSDFVIQFNKNSFGLVNAALLVIPSPLIPGQSTQTSLLIRPGGQVLKMNPLNLLQVAIKNNVGIHYFACNVNINALFADNGRMEKNEFLTLWKDIPENQEVKSEFPVSMTPEQAKSQLEANNVFTIASRTVQSQVLIYTSVEFTNGIKLLAEFKLDSVTCTLSIKTSVPELVPPTQEIFAKILQ